MPKSANPSFSFDTQMCLPSSFTPDLYTALRNGTVERCNVFNNSIYAVFHVISRCLPCSSAIQAPGRAVLDLFISSLLRSRRSHCLFCLQFAFSDCTSFLVLTMSAIVKSEPLEQPITSGILSSVAHGSQSSGRGSPKIGKRSSDAKYGQSSKRRRLDSDQTNEVKLEEDAIAQVKLEEPSDASTKVHLSNSFALSPLNRILDSIKLKSCSWRRSPEATAGRGIDRKCYSQAGGTGLCHWIRQVCLVRLRSWLD